MKKLLLIGSLFLYSLSFGQAKNEKIRELLTLTGAGNLGATYAKQILTHFKSAYPSVPEKVWIDFSNEIKASDLEDLILPLYHKYYTEKDIDDLIVFYKSPVGIKTTKILPQIMLESQEAGKQWGSKIAEKVIKKLKEENYLQDPPPPLPSK